MRARVASGSALAGVAALVATAGVLAVVAVPSPARAGACPTCDDASDCAAPAGGPAFCVLHDSDVGCGEQRRLCCPGQGCGIGGDGRPSCEASGTCLVVDATADAAVAGDDAGTVLPIDAGTTMIDATFRSDAGEMIGRAPGCGCRVAAGVTERSGLGCLALALVALAARMARRRR
jgi:hypothetical protein